MPPDSVQAKLRIPLPQKKYFKYVCVALREVPKLTVCNKQITISVKNPTCTGGRNLEMTAHRISTKPFPSVERRSPVSSRPQSPLPAKARSPFNTNLKDQFCAPNRRDDGNKGDELDVSQPIKAAAHGPIYIHITPFEWLLLITWLLFIPIQPDTRLPLHQVGCGWSGGVCEPQIVSVVSYQAEQHPLGSVPAFIAPKKWAGLETLSRTGFFIDSACPPISCAKHPFHSSGNISRDKLAQDPHTDVLRRLLDEDDVRLDTFRGVPILDTWDRNDALPGISTKFCAPPG
ncbi:hypothetical protein EDC04DRAFT_3088091 [Pisolithus marmoratus]|nr:hypothetical protein EDC04DRAFT_3088091 [Pisolithus marmoratus]